LSYHVAERFKLPAQKAGLRLGADADLALVDLEASFTVEKPALLYRHPQSPYIGRRLRGRVKQTLLRGRTLFKDGKIIAKPLGQLVKPLS
jgi:allantoinase